MLKSERREIENEGKKTYTSVNGTYLQFFSRHQTCYLWYSVNRYHKYLGGYYLCVLKQSSH